MDIGKDNNSLVVFKAFDQELLQKLAGRANHQKVMVINTFFYVIVAARK